MFLLLFFLFSLLDLFSTHLWFNADGSTRCVTCGNMFKNPTTAKNHVKIVHGPPEFYECCLCKQVINSKIMFRMHVFRKHGVRGKDILNTYGRRVDAPDGAFEMPESSNDDMQISAADLKSKNGILPEKAYLNHIEFGYEDTPKNCTSLSPAGGG